jgi:hypothetical protein
LNVLIVVQKRKIFQLNLHHIDRTILCLIIFFVFFQNSQARLISSHII